MASRRTRRKAGVNETEREHTEDEIQERRLAAPLGNYERVQEVEVSPQVVRNFITELM